MARPSPGAARSRLPVGEEANRRLRRALWCRGLRFAGAWVAATHDHQSASPIRRRPQPCTSYFFTLAVGGTGVVPPRRFCTRRRVTALCRCRGPSAPGREVPSCTGVAVRREQLQWEELLHEPGWLAGFAWLFCPARFPGATARSTNDFLPMWAAPLPSMLRQKKARCRSSVQRRMPSANCPRRSFGRRRGLL